MKHLTIFQLDEADFKKVITDELANLQKAAILGQFAGRLVSVDTVAEIHGIHRDTVLRYAKAGLIEYEQTGKLYKFQLSYILNINFHDLKKNR